MDLQEVNEDNEKKAENRATGGEGDRRLGFRGNRIATAIH